MIAVRNVQPVTSVSLGAHLTWRGMCLIVFADKVTASVKGVGRVTKSALAGIEGVDEDDGTASARRLAGGGKGAGR